MPLSLTDFDAVTFDVYGTLIDWEPGIIDFLRAGLTKRPFPGQRRTCLWRSTGRVRRFRRGVPHIFIPKCYAAASSAFRRSSVFALDAAEREAFAATPHQWPAYPDSHVGLKALQAHVRVGALSNIDNASLESSCRKLDFRFDVTVTAERVGAYKPDMPHFQTGIADLVALGISHERILHVGQSLRADITPANRLGLKCAWINRPGRLLGLSGDGAEQAKPDLTVSSLQELVTAITANDRAVA